jgi:hypothetical protein
MNLKKILSMSLLAALIVGLIALAFPLNSVAAQAPTPQPKDPAAKAEKTFYPQMEKLFKAEVKQLKEQAQNFKQAGVFTAKIEKFVAKAKENGKDTAALEAALAQFKTKAAEAKKFHDAAAAILKTHAGFDDKGKVTDPALAKDTLKEAGDALRDGRKVAVEAMKVLREAFKAWREANPKPTV